MLPAIANAGCPIYSLSRALHSGMKKIIASLAVCVGVTGCAATGPVFSPLLPATENIGALYLYRPEAFAMSVLSAVFEVDGRTVATLENNGYAAVRLPAGRYDVTHQWKARLLGNSKLEKQPISRVIEVRPGKAAYVRLTAEALVVTGGARMNTQFTWDIQEVPEEVALPEIQKTRRATVEK